MGEKSFGILEKKYQEVVNRVFLEIKILSGMYFSTKIQKELIVKRNWNLACYWCNELRMYWVEQFFQFVTLSCQTASWIINEAGFYANWETSRHKSKQFGFKSQNPSTQYMHHPFLDVSAKFGEQPISLPRPIFVETKGLFFHVLTRLPH